jgi:hypothetical protein
MDTDLELAINAQHKDGSIIMSFVEHPSNLYVYNGSNNNYNNVAAFPLISIFTNTKRCPCSGKLMHPT